ncbi:MAG TPA: hypothetical protein VMY39_10715 [Planctomycetota bacterium]|nr:hypothetical protein [Planctomycetota bacterium]
MSTRLFLKSIACTGGTVTLELAAGEPVVLTDMAKRRDLPGGLAEHAASVTRGDDAFEVRTVVDVDGNITRVIAGTDAIADDWYETPDHDEE